ncbi:DNA-binding transcriptional regulator, MarR family [Clostridium acidisoli DSM 12555]|jgi:DNA-binding MarR family transcriptional regulator|uniref:HTH-type transcriptional regulator SarZ n=1 Tax=Clostridium acidisoli DSM 12555 TaxID=1121291 RepID=A0A1W1XXI7_9CLOT|nr:MarR family transcriptional regulator [Clostridium acidisoli]SMC28261.1 DNA-binding transcriptional regulator, MarR family [Clostridium acidisoli DSM 12555]
MNYDMLKLDNQLCFALYACSREVTKHYKPELDKLGITYTQYVTLMVLWEKDDITIKELGNRLHLDSGTLTPLLKKLESKGIVQRTRDTEDERNVYVKLTEKGLNLKDEAINIPKRISCIPGQSQEDLIRLREKLKDLLSTLEKL